MVRSEVFTTKKVKGLSARFSDTEYLILIDKELNKLQSIKTLVHEFVHIIKNDFKSVRDANDIEILMHLDEILKEETKVKQSKRKEMQK